MHKTGIVVAEYWTILPPKAELEAKLGEIVRDAQERLARRGITADLEDPEDDQLLGKPGALCPGIRFGLSICPSSAGHRSAAHLPVTGEGLARSGGGPRVSRQAMRQVARRRVQEALATKQKDREAQERRLQASAVAVLTALAERDAAVVVAEQAAAVSIASMVAEGLSLTAVADWCGGLSVREVTRLSKVASKAVA